MLFTGEYEHAIDSKHRLAVPSEIRSGLDPERDGQAFYLAPGPNGHLWLWTERTFERIVGAMEQSLLPAEDLMEFDEFTFPQARRLEMDSAGRVRLPESAMRDAGLAGAVVILGMRDHLELRDPAQWAAQREQLREKSREIFLRARQTMVRRQGKEPSGE